MSDEIWKLDLYEIIGTTISANESEVSSVSHINRKLNFKSFLNLFDVNELPKKLSKLL